MQRIVEESEFLQDLCKLVIYANQLGYLVTRAEQARVAKPHEPLREKIPSECAVGLQFFRRNRGSLERIDEEDYLRLFGDLWESLNSSNAWAVNRDNPLDLQRFARRG